MELVDHVRLRRAEAPRERDELRRRELLRAQCQHLPGIEGALDFGKFGIGQ